MSTDYREAMRLPALAIGRLSSSGASAYATSKFFLQLLDSKNFQEKKKLLDEAKNKCHDEGDTTPLLSNPEDVDVEAATNEHQSYWACLFSQKENCDLDEQKSNMLLSTN